MSSLMLATTRRASRSAPSSRFVRQKRSSPKAEMPSASSLVTLYDTPSSSRPQRSPPLSPAPPDGLK